MGIRHRLYQASKVLLMLFFTAAFIGFGWLQISGGKLFSVQSGSMVPAIPKGSLVVVNRVPDREITVGDVITYISADKQTTITHRVTARLVEDSAGNEFVTKGDANAEQDAPIEAASVVGKVTRHMPYLGYGVDLIRSWPGLVLVVYSPMLFVIISQFKKITEYYRSIKPYSLRKARTV